MSALWPNAGHVAQREYLVRVRSRAFVITTTLLAVAVLAVAMAPTIFTAIGVNDAPPRIALDVQATDLPSDPAVAIRTALVLAGGEGGEAPSVSTAGDPAEAAEAVRDGSLDGLLTISRGADGELAFEYLSNDSPTSLTRLLVVQAAGALSISDRLSRSGIAPAQAAQLFSPPSFTATSADPVAVEDASYGPALLVAYVVVILTFMAIITYGNWVAQSVAEEKSNRVMELLITAATPRQLLTGKVLGTGAAGLTQYLVMVGTVLLGFLANGPVSEFFGLGPGAPFALPSVEPWMLPVLAAFFLLGFVLYSTLYAASGSMVSRIEDVQQAAGPLMFLSIGGYLVSFSALNAPDAGWVAVLSLIPFFSPYLMPTRMLLTSVPASEILIALALMIVTLVAAIWVASRIYSAGVLMYGQRAGLRTVLRATRVSR